MVSFHWINAICVIGLIATGLIVLNGDVLGLSAEGKVALKSVHVATKCCRGPPAPASSRDVQRRSPRLS